MSYRYEISIDISEDWLQSDLSTHIKYMKFLNFRGYCKTYFDSYDGVIQVYKQVEFPTDNNQIYHNSEKTHINFYRNQLGLCRENEKATFYHVRPLGYKVQNWIEKENPPRNGEIVLATNGKFIQKAAYVDGEWLPIKVIEEPYDGIIHDLPCNLPWRDVTYWQKCPSLPIEKGCPDDQR